MATIDELQDGARVYTRGNLAVDDHDEGHVADVDLYENTGCVMVSWDSGVATPCDPDSLGIGERPAGAVERLRQEREDGPTRFRLDGETGVMEGDEPTLLEYMQTQD